ncbi:hypothetical protein QBZ16_002309 [Prototheca wickerhamii]|uniref:Uncharacterized protein n=1 Tax=Prototheca wickerhamii TaxID=3111 RepID=A0AAD9IMG0_PROWI|nr:hypothetical protein QBZ16_002309 [Prototheca wickerhamii]
MSRREVSDHKRAVLEQLAVYRKERQLRVARARQVLTSDDEDGESDTGASIAQKLYPHQIAGVKWLHGLLRVGKGGILADDMGLGKTMQCCAYLAGALASGTVSRALVVAPKTLVAHWAADGLHAVRARGGVLLTTYGVVQHNAAALAAAAGPADADEPRWDLVICDEGHKLKNPDMDLRQQFEKVPARTRIIISGTPIQNNLRELWSLFEFTTPGLLGDRGAFKDAFELDIVRGNDKHATRGMRERGVAAAEALRRKTAPFVLRREKGQVAVWTGRYVQTVLMAKQPAADSDGGAAASSNAGSQSESAGADAPKGLPRKTDLIVWLRLNSQQLQLYQAFMESPAVQGVLNRAGSALAALSVARKICVHPALLSERAQQGILGVGDRGAQSDQAGDGAGTPGRSGAASDDDDDDDALPSELWGTSVGSEDDEVRRLLAQVDHASLSSSCKMAFVVPLLEALAAGGHRTLVFSQRTRALDLLEAALRASGAVLAAPGRPRDQRGARAALVRAFQRPPPGSAPPPVFLLSSVVGGLGLTLTAADRVVVLDPAWNPTVDDQAVDRAYRLGQTRDVVVYRLITCGTVEEKMYRRQVFKRGLSRTGLEAGQQLRYFADAELGQLLSVDAAAAAHSLTRRRLLEEHGPGAVRDEALRADLARLRALPGFEGVSDHGLLYSQAERDPVAVREHRPAPPKQPRGPRWVAGGGGARVPGSPVRRAATQGAGQLSDLFARSLTLEAPQVPPQVSAAELAAARRREAEAALRKQEELLAKPWLLEKLPDKGDKVRDRVAALRRELAELDRGTCPEASERGGGARPKADSAAASPLERRPEAEARADLAVSRREYKLLKKELHKQAAALESLAADDPGVPELRARVKALRKQYRAAKAALSDEG